MDLQEAKKLQKDQVKSIPEGREKINQIEQSMTELLYEMRETDDNKKHQELTDLRYELTKAKRNIQSQMQYMVRMQIK